MNYQTYMNMVLENLIDMDNLTLINFLNDKIPEITVDFSKSRIGEMKIDINFNKTLSDKRNFSNKYITSDLKKNGFVTGYVSDVCFNDFVRSYHNFSFDDIYDHHYAICDPNYLNLSPKLECFYGKLYIEYMFDYINQFWKKYNNK